MQTKSFFLSMADGFELWINRWIPDNDVEIKGIVQLHHGLQEHSMRYDRLGSVLAEKGYVLNAYDMRGHGKTAENSVAKGKGIFGKLADENGYKIIVNDLQEVIQNVKNDFKDKPVILLGHSFGSFVVQSYIEKYGDVDSCILSGTSGPMSPLKIMGGKLVTSILKFSKNPDEPSDLLYNMSFSSYNKRIPNPKYAYEWLSKNELNLVLYGQDQWCGQPLTISFYYDMVRLLASIHSKNNIKKISKELPVLFIYGTEDPVGNYGKSIEKLAKLYKKTGLKTVEVKAYDGDRHEILNEDDKDQVEADILEWCYSAS